MHKSCSLPSMFFLYYHGHRSRYPDVPQLPPDRHSGLINSSRDLVASFGFQVGPPTRPPSPVSPTGVRHPSPPAPPAPPTPASTTTTTSTLSPDEQQSQPKPVTTTNPITATTSTLRAAFEEYYCTSRPRPPKSIIDLYLRTLPGANNDDDGTRSRAANMSEGDRLWKFRKPEWMHSVWARNAGVYAAGGLVCLRLFPSLPLVFWQQSERRDRESLGLIW